MCLHTMWYVALHVLVNFKVECTSQWDCDGDVLCGDGVGMEKNHGDWVGMGLIFNTMSLFKAYMTEIYTLLSTFV